MNSFVEQYSTTNLVSQLRRAQRLAEEEDEISDAAWGSQAGFGNLAKGLPTFTVPDVPDVSPRDHYDFQLPELIAKIMQPTAFLRLHTDDHADPNCKIKIQHGTTTLAFRFQGGVIVAVDSRATAGSYIGNIYIYRV